MSQEINLLNPALRPKRDWLSFRYVALGGAAALGLVAVATAALRFDLAAEQKAQASAAARLAAVRDEVQALQARLAARRPDPALEQQAANLAAAIGQRQEVLELARGLAAEDGGFADAMLGFSRQRVEGVWLTAFSVGAAGFDIRGRLLDPALLPAYIRRLNAEPAFRGRHFAALDMLGVEPAPPAAAGAQAPALVPPAAATGPARYTEFFLRAALGNTPAAGGRQ
ncbi:hypothetical protein [Azospira restricta]|uniref:MSHA biogenesis protein MshI n=1 Tax=Azospira restricta TaxID=404405 RepID=A0A974SRH7_9RHOO|nr:hypothetical protein [Azospira restricta]QRJ65094.1 hypothetical protein IWH25_07070 [Azospira restricta]